MTLSNYQRAAHKGANWLLTQLQPDGCFIRPGLKADVYHKAVTAFTLTGHAREAFGIVDWAKKHDLQRDGELRHYNLQYALYKSSWLVQGAHRIGRFDLSVPAMKNILRWQTPCGGFYEAPRDTRCVETVCASWAGTAAIYLGHIEAARRVGDCLIRLLDQQPDENKLYCLLTPRGKLITKGDGIVCLDARQKNQRYYYPGLMMLFLARLYLATSEKKYLRAAQALFDFNWRSASDAFANTMSGKTAVASAILYTVTRDRRALIAARRQADFLVAQQNPRGWWRNPLENDLITHLDHTAEFVVFLTEIAAILGSSVGGRLRRANSRF